MSSKPCQCCGKPAEECSCWEFPGWGKVTNIVDLSADPINLDSSDLPSSPSGANRSNIANSSSISEIPTQHRATPQASSRLGVWRATAICGNDITSSCLYVSALAALYAGPLAPLALLLVAGVLYLFRGIYAEVGSALPLNGGAYNVLLNTTTKARAALAACLTLLSYIATAVISGSEAMSYAADLLPMLNLFWATVVLLGAFAMLNIMGISDSASVALAIFVFHIGTLIVLVVIGVAAAILDPSVLMANLQMPIGQWPTHRSGGMLIALFFGFSAAMLGISGFESSANYIEEQQPGVFPKTLRNMWIAVALFNPTISFLSFALLPMGEIATHKEALLSEMGRRGVENIGGFPADSVLPQLVSGWISLDAVVVLSGAVLTSYVGVTGLVRRMSMDLCLPQFLLRRNRWRGTNHWIVISFFLLCCSILLITAGRIEVLAGVYTLSFLSVMALFAVGNLLLKRKHPHLKRTTRVGVTTVLVALTAVLAALVGNVLLDPEYVRIFMFYFATASAVVGLMFARSRLLTLALRTAIVFCQLPLIRKRMIRDKIVRRLENVQCRSILFVASEGTRDELRKAAEYVTRNESFRILDVVWCYEQESDIPERLHQIRKEVDEEFPALHIDLLLVRGHLEPALLAALSQRFAVSPNHIFITATTAASADDLASWGGVRIVA